MTERPFHDPRQRSSGAAPTRGDGPELERPQEAERAAVEALLKEAGLPLAGLDAAWPDALVARSQDGVVVGHAALERHGNAALLRSVVTAPTHRGLGLGKALCWRVIDRARATGAEDIFLLTTTAETLFARMGFETITRDALPRALLGSEELRGACPDTATVMVLRGDGIR